MRILFVAQSAPGHVIPLMSLQRAAASAGHETAVMTGAEMSELVGDAPMLAVGPTMDEIMQETIRRPQGGDPSQPGPGAIELFAGTTVDLTFDDAFRDGTRFGPEIVISDPLHVTAQLLAAALGVPWASVEISGGIPPALAAALAARAEQQSEARSLRLTEPVARLDPYPDVLHGPDWTAPADRIPMRSTAFGTGDAPTIGPVQFPQTRKVVLISLGTSIFERDGDPLPELLAAALGCNVNMVVTCDPAEIPPDADPRRVRAVGFVPLSELLPSADVVISAGGTGTVLATLAAGLKMVIRPVKADQPLNAQRAGALGSALVVDSGTDAAAALSRVLDEPRFEHRAREISAEIASMPTPREALDELIRRIEARSGES